jgi:hypothetical protein
MAAASRGHTSIRLGSGNVRPMPFATGSGPVTATGTRDAPGAARQAAQPPCPVMARSRRSRAAPRQAVVAGKGSSVSEGFIRFTPRYARRGGGARHLAGLSTRSNVASAWPFVG